MINICVCDCTVYGVFAFIFKYATAVPCRANAALHAALAVSWSVFFYFSPGKSTSLKIHAAKIEQTSSPLS